MVATLPFPAARVYVGTEPNRANLVTGTARGDFDENETEAPGIYIPPGQSLIVEWTGTIGAGDTAMVRVEYVEA